MSQIGISTGSATVDTRLDAEAIASSTTQVLLELSKPGIVKLAATSTAIGFLLAALNQAWPSLWVLAVTFVCCMVGTVLSGAGANALNMVIEHRRDAVMRRTMNRPIPSGRLSVRHGLLAAIAFSVAGVAVLAVGTNLIAALVALATIVSYAFVYTPLKPLTTASTIVGAFPGALPPMIGWAAASSGVYAGLDQPGGWTLFAIIFVWQIPHFLAIAWKYREDYASGGYRVLPVVDPSGRRTSRATLVWSVALVPISLTPIVALPGMFDWLYLVVALVAGLWMLRAAMKLAMDRTDANARGLFIASIIYLPVILLAMLADSLLPALA